LENWRIDHSWIETMRSRWAGNARKEETTEVKAWE
jgi:hypothetical protein